jgi:hypothetical protein
MLSKRFAAGWIAVCLSFMACGPVAAQFVHPGCLSTQADLDRIADKVAANATFYVDNLTNTVVVDPPPPTNLSRGIRSGWESARRGEH